MKKTLPNNWIETSLGAIGNIETGNTPSKNIQSYYGSEVPWAKPGDINKTTILFETEEYLSIEGSKKARVLPAESIMVTCIGNLGNVAIAGLSMATNQQINSIVINHQLVNKKYVYYYALTLKSWLVENSTSTTISMVNKSNFEKAPIPLPPLPEQERIANKLDALFTQLDVIRAAMERIPTLLKNFRQQVLTQAVTGKLTEEWREGKVLDDWRVEKIEKLVDKISDGPFGSNLKTSDYSSHGVRVIRLENIGELQFNEEYRSFVSNEKYETIKKHTVKKGDIIFSSFISEKIRTVILPDHIDKAVNKADCFLIRTNEKVFNRTCLVYFLSTRLIYDQLTKNIHGSTRPRINTTQLKQALVPFPPLLEQQEIARRIEILFSRADAIEQQYQNLKQKIDNLPQAILHKAFKGELVEQFPTDGDARGLLHQIEELKQLTKKKK